jgi:lipopolysaccharide cholinephosphotransferase
MEFEESFFQGEEREGFFVEEMMKRAWAAQLEVMKEIEKFCKNHGINYYAEWGTLLGAVRHKGFIPWDDDIDISMKREDYQVLLKYGDAELPEGYFIMTVDREAEVADPLMRIVNSRTINLSEEFLKKYHGCPYAVGLDIVPYDYIPDDGAEHDIQHALLQAAIAIKAAYREGRGSEEELKQLEELCNCRINREKSIIQQLNILIDRLSALYTKDECRYIGPMHHYAVYGDCKMPKEWFGEPVWLPFENTQIPVPTNYLEVVKAEYGENYMTPVRVETHDYPFYKKQQKYLEEAMKKARE